MDKKIKIGFDAKRLFHNDTGLGNYSRTLVAAIAKYYPKYEIHLFTPTIRETEETSKFLKHPYIVHTAGKKSTLWWRVFGVSKDLVKHGIEIFHGLSHELPFGINSKIKTVLTFHDLIWEKFPNQFNFFDNKIYRYKYKSSAQRADRVISISQSTADDLVKLYNIDSNKIDICYQSCNPFFYETTNELPFDQRTHFLFVGSIIERKGLLQIIKAFALIPELKRKKFIVIGRGSDYKQKCLDEIAKLKLQKWFVFEGQKTNEELRAYYDQAIAFVFPSIYEGFGIPVIESLFRSTPVITSNTSSLSEAAGPGGILVDPLSVEQIADAMESIQKRDVWIDAVEKGKQYVDGAFGLEDVTSEVVKVYEGLGC